MALRLKILMIAATLLAMGSIWAEGPEILVITSPATGDSGEFGATILYAGNNLAPPPLVLVDGNVVAGGSANGGPPDCSKAENRPICVSLNAVMESYSGGGPPDIIVVSSGGDVQILDFGNANSPPPLVIVNGEVVAGG